MSLYGLDMIVDRDGKRHIIEVNGVRSGMKGFEKIYGDNRVEEKVHSMLQEKYGTLTQNDGSYARILASQREIEFRQKRPILSRIFNIIEKIDKVPYLKKLLEERNPFHLSKKAEIEWLKEKLSEGKEEEATLKPKKFEAYKGQESVVLNFINDILPHPTVNSFVAEEFASNKFLQYELLKDTEIGKDIPHSALVGLGFSNDSDIEELYEKAEKFVIKPVLGYCGKGVKFIDKKELLRKYYDARGSAGIDSKVFDLKFQVYYMVPPYSWILKFYNTQNAKTTYIEDFVDKNDFSFESALAVAQPFVDSRINRKYSSIRAIICNGKFVDAYKRVSKNPKVNLAQGAGAEKFHYDEQFSEYCEKVIRIFESKASEYTPENHQKFFYDMYVERRGRTSKEQKELDKEKEAIAAGAYFIAPFLDPTFMKKLSRIK
ncbi:MAG TPA: hypothetical protein VEC16_02510 [Alphaproteobacteria bacterium]|nr:hypothetical protein [Alphaproteobacteria bacterium]